MSSYDRNTSYILQAKLTSRYIDLVKDLYTEPTEDIVVGNLFNFVMTLPPTVVIAPSKRKEKVYIHKHYCFKQLRHPRNARSSKEEKNTIVIVVDGD